MSQKVLVADDDGLSRDYLTEALRAAGCRVTTAASGRQARALFERDRFDVVFSDLRMPEGNGIDVLRAVKAKSPETPVVLVTAFGSVECAVEAMRDGAEDFIVKPFSVEQIDLLLARLARRRAEGAGAVDAPALREDEIQNVGESRAWRDSVALARRVARTRATVLVRGESGTGKEVIASLLHAWCGRASGPFVKTNCAALHEGLLASELFGHEKGAFTGAFARKEGRFELAHGGTLFLDEIGELPPEIQAKLLRVIETGEFERVGGKETLTVDCRLVCATNRDLESMMAEGRFREDLFYRLNVFPIRLAPLRERRGDVLPLARHFLGRFAAEYGAGGACFTAGAESCLEGHDWPGNVRELMNHVQRAILLRGSQPIEAGDLGLGGRRREGESEVPVAAGRTIAEVERRLILATLTDTGNNKTEAARILGVTARTLSNKMKLWRMHGLLPAEAR